MTVLLDDGVLAVPLKHCRVSFFLSFFLCGKGRIPCSQGVRFPAGMKRCKRIVVDSRKERREREKERGR